MAETVRGVPAGPPRLAPCRSLLLGGLVAGTTPLVPLAVLVARHEARLLPLFAVPLGLLVTVVGVSRARARDRLVDPLTGLPNRQALLLATRSAIAGAAAQSAGAAECPRGRRRPPAGAAVLPLPVTPRAAPLPARTHASGTPEPGRVGLILLDLNRFRSVNDALGHAAGDRLLVQSARRIRQVLEGAPGLPPRTPPPPTAPPGTPAGSPPAADGSRPPAVVARTGADEFAVLLPGVGSPEVLRRLAGTLNAALAAPVRAEGLLLVLEASAGIAVHPDHAPDAETLLRRADAAMSQAQSVGTGVEVYSSEHDTETPGRLGLLGDLRRALEAGEVRLHYQPKVAFDGRVAGLEALVRWDRPGHGPVDPEEFVALAESGGLMPRLTGYVLELAVAQLARWRGQGLGVQVAVNVSPRDVLTPGFAAGVADCLARHRVPPRALQLEITERVLLDDAPRAAAILGELRRCGVGLSLDDFGTGYSSLARLRSLPVGELKIDRLFVSRMASDDHDAAVVRCSVELAHSLGLTVVAEGVEDDLTWERLRRLGVDAVQGWLVAGALPPDRATAWLRARRAAVPGDGTVRGPGPRAVAGPA